MMKAVDTTMLVTYSTDGPSKEVFYDSGALKAQITCLKAGQVIPPCKMNNDVLFFIIEGEGEITVDDITEKLKPGISVVVPKEAQSRSMQAQTDMVFLGVQGK